MKRGAFTRIVSLASLTSLVLVAGCALTPDYERAELDLPETWVDGPDSQESIANIRWWALYQDATLIELIEQALEANQDLALALARMQEFEYLVTFTRADQFPFLGLTGGAGRGRQSRKIIPSAETASNFSIGANLSFEIDLWRKYDRATEAARADLLASEAAYRNVTIGLISNVASGYLLLRDLDTRLDISRRTAKGRRDRLDIIRARFDKGTVPLLDVNQAEVQLAIADAAIAFFERQAAQTEHALRVLLGQYPGDVPRGEPIRPDSWPIEVPAGIPSELLQRRPDLVEAEQRLKAETDRIGVAQAMRFPALSLTANVGVVAESLTDLNTTDAGEWNIMAGIFQPLFNSGQLKAQKEAQTARAEQAQAVYIRAIQNALREVEDSLISIDTLRREREARERQVAAARSALRLSQARYDGGVVDYLEVLDSERTLFDAELEESSVRRQSLTAYVTLYKALGGGWEQGEDDDADEPQDPNDADAAQRANE
jgi:multidrug efflux system outer membrane protein